MFVDHNGNVDEGSVFRQIKITRRATACGLYITSCYAIDSHTLFAHYSMNFVKSSLVGAYTAQCSLAKQSEPVLSKSELGLRPGPRVPGSFCKEKWLATSCNLLRSLASVSHGLWLAHADTGSANNAVLTTGHQTTCRSLTE
jgi:hypothetical protein